MGCGPSTENSTIPAATRKGGGGTKGKSAWLVVVCVKEGDFQTSHDYYAEIQVGDTPLKRTQVIRDKNPKWNRQFQCFSSPIQSQPQSVKLTIFDKDLLTKDDFIGSALHNIDKWEGTPELVEMKIQNAGKDIGTVKLQFTFKQILPDHPEYDGLFFQFSHLLALRVEEAKGLSNEAQNVELSWGEVSFKTQNRNASDPKWKGQCSFWVDEDTQKQFKLKVAVLNKGAIQHVGFIDGAVLLEFANKDLDIWVSLAKAETMTDKALGGLDDKMTEKSKIAEVHLVGRLESFDKVKDSFYTRMINEFDDNQNGDLDYSEAWMMVNILGVDIKGETFDAWINYADANNDGKISRDEIRSFLDAMSHSNKQTANALGGLLGSVALDVDCKKDLQPNDVMMEGVTHKSKINDLKIKDRETGLIVEEAVPMYVKVALKVLFGSTISRAMSTTGSSKGIMEKLSIKQGKKFDNPKSAEEIPGFVQLHNLNLEEVLKPLADFKTFNEFFARELKPNCRPIASPEDPKVVVSPADCRLMVFSDVNDATSLWIKGDKFSITSVLGPRADLVPKFDGGSMVIARLAPQDYHRFHFPVAGKIVRRDEIAGALYTVNPLAIRKNVNVYTENKRHIVELQSDLYGTVVIVPVGATMVGSIAYCVGDDAKVNKGDTHGYFSFGGSTVLLFFQPNTVIFDKDLVKNSEQSLETLVKVNSRIAERRVF